MNKKNTTYKTSCPSIIVTVETSFIKICRLTEPFVACHARIVQRKTFKTYPSRRKVVCRSVPTMLALRHQSHWTLGKQMGFESCWGNITPREPVLSWAVDKKWWIGIIFCTTPLARMHSHSQFYCNLNTSVRGQIVVLAPRLSMITCGHAHADGWSSNLESVILTNRQRREAKNERQQQQRTTNHHTQRIE